MKYLKSLLASFLLLTGVLIGSSVSRIPVALAACSTDAWCIVSTPNVSSVNNTLWDVAVVANDDVWAVGWTDSSGVETALVMHYDGSSWTTSSILTLSNFYS